jgi:hypothetical protein
VCRRDRRRGCGGRPSFHPAVTDTAQRLALLFVKQFPSYWASITDYLRTHQQKTLRSGNSAGSPSFEDLRPDQKADDGNDKHRGCDDHHPSSITYLSQDTHLLSLRGIATGSGVSRHGQQTVTGVRRPALRPFSDRR